MVEYILETFLTNLMNFKHIPLNLCKISRNIMGRFFRKNPTGTEESWDSTEITEKAKSWKEVLNEIYRYLPSEYGWGKGGITDDHPLAKKLKISGFELNQGLIFLSEQGLIDRKGADKNWFNLTEKGFNVALENEKHRTNIHLQLLVGIFTIILVITGIFDFLRSLNI